MQLVQINPFLLRISEESHRKDSARTQEGSRWTSLRDAAQVDDLEGCRWTTDQRKLRQTMTLSSAFLPPAVNSPGQGKIKFIFEYQGFSSNY